MRVMQESVSVNINIVIKNDHEKNAPGYSISVVKKNGVRENFSLCKLDAYLKMMVDSYALKDVNESLILNEVVRSLYNEITTKEISELIQFACCQLIEQDHVYSKLASCVMIESLVKSLSSEKINDEKTYESLYRKSFLNAMIYSVESGLFDSKMSEYDWDDLSHYLCFDRDSLFDYMGIFTLKERYLIKINKQPIESPQGYWMRIAMGLALNEKNKQQRAKEFYDILSQFLYTPSTPTLFHSGFKVAQLSSCYLNISSDDLHNIFKTFSDNAQLSKWAGGIATSWTRIRGAGAYIKGIKSTSQGVIPYLKIADDVIGAITKAGIRRGGKCAYLEPWHYDFEDFLDLRRNTGDHRRRTHDMNTASWIPDLFMKRVKNNEEWMLISSDEAADLHELYGKAFEQRYCYYESLAHKGDIKLFKFIKAADLWKKMIMRLFETGHPWITFKDASNVRSPQDHCGVVHSSNLCTEITLNTSKNETAVCNLGSINLSRFVTDDKKINYTLLQETIFIAVRTLDNVIDLNFYPIPEAQSSNAKHRPIGMGVMGWQDMLFQLDVEIASEESKRLADELMEFISYNAIAASCALANERGKYASFEGSKWDRGIFPVDTLSLLEEERNEKIFTNKNTHLDWNILKDHVKTYGLRNSNMMAIAPTATISTITGSCSSTAALFSNLYVISNVSGEFTVVNKYLVEDLKKLGLWNIDMLEEIKFHNGSIQKIERIPLHLRNKYLTCFEVDQKLLLELTALRGKWIDQSQSHNVFYSGTSGKDLSEIYFYAWESGLKTTYYLRTLGASQIEKSTVNAKTYGFTQIREKTEKTVQMCSINDEGCLSCQ